MAEPGQVDTDVFDYPEDAPIRLVGPPGALRGEIALRNSGDTRMVIRQARIRRGDAEREAGVPPGRAMVAAILLPGQVHRAPITVEIGPRTPPGVIEAEIEIGGSVRTVHLHVTEKISLDISPQEIFLVFDGEPILRKEAVITNSGNVACKIPGHWSATVEDEFAFCKTVRGALRAVDQEEKKLDAIVAKLVHGARTALDLPGVLGIRNTNGALTLMPGDAVALELEIRAPSGLSPRSRYRARIPVYNANLSFVLVSVAGEKAPTDQEPAERAV